MRAVEANECLSFDSEEEEKVEAQADGGVRLLCFLHFGASYLCYHCVWGYCSSTCL